MRNLLTEILSGEITLLSLQENIGGSSVQYMYTGDFVPIKIRRERVSYAVRLFQSDPELSKYVDDLGIVEDVKLGNVFKCVRDMGYGFEEALAIIEYISGRSKDIDSADLQKEMKHWNSYPDVTPIAKKLAKSLNLEHRKLNKREAEVYGDNIYVKLRGTSLDEIKATMYVGHHHKATSASVSSITSKVLEIIKDLGEYETTIRNVKPSKEGGGFGGF